MDAPRIGRSLRALRLRRGLRQADLAASVGISRSQVSKLERGAVGRAPLDDLDGLCRALGADLDVRVRWHGEGIDRLLDAAHASLVEATVAMLVRAGWDAAVEVTFNHFGERGSVDVLGWHAASSAILVVEVKSVVPDAQATIASLGRKTRLAGVIGRGRGWDPKVVGSLLLVADTSTSRRRIRELAGVFHAAYPDRGVVVRHWLRRPGAPLAGLIFLPDSPGGRTSRTPTGRQRVRLPRNGSIRI